MLETFVQRYYDYQGVLERWWLCFNRDLYSTTLQIYTVETGTVHSGSEGTDSLSRESDQKLAALYSKTNRDLPFLKAAKGCFENSMK